MVHRDKDDDGDQQSSSTTTSAVAAVSTTHGGNQYTDGFSTIRVIPVIKGEIPKMTSASTMPPITTTITITPPFVPAATNNQVNKNNNIQQQNQQQTQQHTCACRDVHSPLWVPLSHLGTGPVAPYTYWMRPVCTHGCDDSELLLLDRICFPQEHEAQLKHTMYHSLRSKYSCGVAIVKDLRSPAQQQTQARQLAAQRGTAVSRFFSSCFGGSDAAEQNNNRPLPPQQNQSQIIAYATGKIRSSARCRSTTVNPMCEVQGEMRPDSVCADVQSVAVAPAFRKLGLGEFVMTQVMEQMWHLSHKAKAERIAKFKEQQQQQQQRQRRSARFVDAEEMESIRRLSSNNHNNDNDAEEYADTASDNDDDNENDGSGYYIDIDAQNAAKALKNSNLRQQQRDPWPATIPIGGEKESLHVTLCVRRDNVAARKLYTRLGFVFMEGTQQLFYGDGCLMDRMGTWVNY